MIHFNRDGNGAVAPISLTGIDEKAENDDLLKNRHAAAVNEGKPMKFKPPNIYGNHSVKSQLKLISYGKCCYCDSYIEDVEHGDVEHFRPKSKYWWLAYTWENLLYACQICNQSYKMDNFPINGSRATDPQSNLNNESNLLINPIDEYPEPLISYDVDGDGVSITPRSNSALERIGACIRYYGLNREKLLNSRRRVLNYLKVYYTLYSDPNATNNQKDIIRQQIGDMAADSSEFAGMVRFYLDRWGIPI